MATVVIAESARRDLDAMILTHSLPVSTRDRVVAALRPLSEFPLLGPALIGRWQGFRFVLGPWPRMLLVYRYDEVTDQVAVVTIQDSRSARAATGPAGPGTHRDQADQSGLRGADRHHS